MLDFLTGAVLGLHLASVHVPAEPYHHNVNPGAYVVFPQGVAVGAYHNSLGRTSAYVGKVLDFSPFALTVGVVSGYQKVYSTGRCANGKWGTSEQPCIYGMSRGALSPMLTPSVLLGGCVRLSLVLGIQASSAVHLSIEGVL